MKSPETTDRVQDTASFFSAGRLLNLPQNEDDKMLPIRKIGIRIVSTVTSSIIAEGTSQRGPLWETENILKIKTEATSKQ
jgi:hypothetical protein